MITDQEKLARVSKDLMLEEPFYGIFLIMLNKVWNKRIPTACVSRNTINFQLTINPEFWNTLETTHQKGLLKHELLHIGFFHITDFGHLKNKKIANLAMDCEINQYISSTMLPPGGILPSSFPELNLDLKAGTNYYYNQLLQGANDKSCPNLNNMLEAMGNGEETVIIKIGGSPSDVQLPNHGEWEEFEGLDEATVKLMKTQTENILKEVAQQVNKSRGIIPGEFAEILENIDCKEPPKFDWRGYLRRFTEGSQKVYTKKMRRKYNKRYEDNPGLKIKPKRHILVAIDTSGSVSTGELKEFMHEIAHIHKSGSEVTIVQADTAIKKISSYRRGDQFEVFGRGGTCFQPVINYYNEQSTRYTCLVYFTDGEAPSPDNARGRILWVLSSGSQDNTDLPGSTIKLN